MCLCIPVLLGFLSSLPLAEWKERREGSEEESARPTDRLSLQFLPCLSSSFTFVRKKKKKCSSFLSKSCLLSWKEIKQYRRWMKQGRTTASSAGSSSVCIQVFSLCSNNLFCSHNQFFSWQKEEQLRHEHENIFFIIIVGNGITLNTETLCIFTILTSDLYLLLSVSRNKWHEESEKWRQQKLIIPALDLKKTMKRRSVFILFRFHVLSVLILDFSRAKTRLWRTD